MTDEWSGDDAQPVADPGVLPSALCGNVEKVFRELARLTKGQYFKFTAGAARGIADLLREIAVYAAGGLKALENRNTESARKLLGQLKKGDDRKWVPSAAEKRQDGRPVGDSAYPASIAVRRVRRAEPTIQVKALFDMLPPGGVVRPPAEREAWFAAARAMFGLVYREETPASSA
jgi:hypothetical protein